MKIFNGQTLRSGFLKKRVKPKSSGYKPPLLPERSNYIFRITTKKKKSMSTFIGGEIQVGRKVLLLSTSWLRKYTNKQVYTTIVYNRKKGRAGAQGVIW